MADEGMVIAMAKYMPEDTLVDMLEKSIVDYKKEKNEKTKSVFIMNLGLLFSRYMLEGKTVEETVKDMEKQKEAKDLYNRITGDSQ